MSSNTRSSQHTQHAFLVAWGWFAEETGLVQKLQAIRLKQKTYDHTPQSKVLEFLVGTLSGVRHLQEISKAAHPLDRDQAVAEAWGQPGWADYTGVSRTLSALSGEDVRAIVGVLEEISRPYLQAELQRLRSQGQRLRLDGDLTGLPVSNSSRTYPNAAYGHADDEIRLGYQAGVVSLVSPTYGRLWLSVAHHPGDTVSCTQAEALVLEAERRTGQHPQRRTALLRTRLTDFESRLAQEQGRLDKQQQAVERVQARLSALQQLAQERQAQLETLEKDYQAHQRSERPTGKLAQARKRSQAAERRVRNGESARQAAERRLARARALGQEQQAAKSHLQERLQRFEQDNEANREPVEAEFRLDAGFGTYENVALLIEMGYEVYTKPRSHRVTAYLQRQVDEHTVYTRVGANAEMVAWADRTLARCPYPLDMALERFYTGPICKHSALWHYGSDPVTQDVRAWFAHYNGRQTIEAGIKESKQVFYLHKIKVRSEPAIFLQENCVLFAANFIRWASHWLAEQAQPVRNTLDVRQMGVKCQVHVAAHVSAQVIRSTEGRLLRFSQHSIFAGKVLHLPSGHL